MGTMTPGDVRARELRSADDGRQADGVAEHHEGAEARVVDVSVLVVNEQEVDASRLGHADHGSRVDDLHEQAAQVPCDKVVRVDHVSLPSIEVEGARGLSRAPSALDLRAE